MQTVFYIDPVELNRKRNIWSRTHFWHQQITVFPRLQRCNKIILQLRGEEIKKNALSVTRSSEEVAATEEVPSAPLIWLLTLLCVDPCRLFSLTSLSLRNLARRWERNTGSLAGAASPNTQILLIVFFFF